MKSINIHRFILFVSVIFAGFGVLEVRSQVTPPGLVSRWSGENDTNDSIGSNNGIQVGNVTFPAGKIGQAFSFTNPATSGYVQTPTTNLPTGDSDRTMALWVKINSYRTSRESVLAAYGTFAGFNQLYFLGTFSDGRVYFSQWGQSIAGPILQLGTWYHVAVTNVGNFTTLYVDGQPVASGNQSINTSSGSSLVIGKTPAFTAGYGDYGLNGVIDELTIFDRALPDCEVRSLYDPTDGCDFTAPTTTAATTPSANDADWHDSNVSLLLSATDNSESTGVSNITYSTSGAETIGQTLVNGSTASLSITAEGETTITYFAEDNAGNAEAAQTLVVRIDKTAPVITSQAMTDGNPYTAGTWTNQNVVVTFDCTDALSGVASVTQPITLSSAGENQTANGVCTDIASNSVDASSVNIRIDKTAPDISITAPTNGSYQLHQAVTTNYTCSDGGSGVASCTGTTADGSSLDTSSIGSRTFSVNATDNAGNSSSPTTVNYTVGFGIQALFDQTKAHKSGSTVPIKIRLVDANGANISSATTLVHAVSVIQTGSQASPILEDAGSANPDYDFRYDQSSEGYIFNLKTTSYGTGTYQLNFIAGNGSTIYSVGFQVRQ